MSPHSVKLMRSGDRFIDAKELRIYDEWTSRFSVGRKYQTMLGDNNLDTWAHLPFLKEHAKGNVLEIGVHCGISTTALLAGVEENGGHVYSVDVHPSCRYVWYGHPQWTFFCPWAWDEVNTGGPIDLLFIDGDHSYEGVMADLSRYSFLVNPGGLILCHDADTASFPGVRKAIDEYCSAHGLKHELRRGSSGMEVIYA
jgi:Methyltransferase domain